MDLVAFGVADALRLAAAEPGIVVGETAGEAADIGCYTAIFARVSPDKSSKK